MDGDWLAQEYPQLEIASVVQGRNEFMVLFRSDIYHWGVNLETTIAEINVLKRGKREVNYDLQPCCGLHRAS